MALPTAVRYKTPSTGSTYIYVNNVSGNDANDGLTSGTAKATLHNAVMETVFNTWDLSLASEPVIVKLATSGTPYQGIHLAGAWTGGQGHRAVVIEGDTSNPQNTVIGDHSGGGPIFVADGGGIALRGVYLTSATGACISASRFGRVQILNDVIFGSAANAHVFCANEGSVYFENNYKIDGGAAYHFQCLAKAQITCWNVQATFTNNCNFSGNFILTQALSHSACGGWSYNANGKTITGNKYYVSGGAFLEVAGGNANNMFPGNSNGTVSSPGFVA